MQKQNKPRPTERELAILNILWDNGPSTIRQVNEVMNKDRLTGYTTTLKLMQIMTEKGLLTRDDSPFRHIYKTNVGREQTQSQIIGQVLDKVFAGSAEKLVMRALSAKKVSREELAKIRKLLNEIKDK